MVLNKRQKVLRKVQMVLNKVYMVLRITKKVLKYMPAAMQKLKLLLINYQISV